MCGGRGTRLREVDGTNDADAIPPDREKPLVEICGRSMLARVVDALRASGLDGTIHAVVSPQTPATADRAADLSVSVVETPGAGYVSDLGAALASVGRPALTVPADLPLLAPEHVDDARSRARVADGRSDASTDAETVTSLTVCVPAVLKQRLGASVGTTFESAGRAVAPTGLNVAAGDDDTVALTYDARLAVNVNRPGDVALAEVLCE
ncbi:GTP:adenosylcobinamide-phosphate guanylyltransferase [Halobellus clavatus]|uniref:GTP:adenosylcobinamide-phosphate guanylyltransferase n=2 Tax=Halobellus clavatus TaxID=660517 RepID=A0A1H3CXB8_9EURY|nr:GTP:adenosylcobinamide-phosphate guanylyltransferase [Halobellus clavatus]